jgi:hypothetical protein
MSVVLMHGARQETGSIREALTQSAGLLTRIGLRKGLSITTNPQCGFSGHNLQEEQSMKVEPRARSDGT